jgi:hypothetical protein
MRSVFIAVTLVLAALSACSLYFEYPTQIRYDPDAATVDAGQLPRPDALVLDGSCCGQGDAGHNRPDAGGHIDAGLPGGDAGLPCDAGSPGVDAGPPSLDSGVAPDARY